MNDQMTTTTSRTSRYKTLSDEQLAAAVDALERRIDALDCATWPAASLQRQECLDDLLQVRLEQERRRT